MAPLPPAKVSRFRLAFLGSLVVHLILVSAVFVLVHSRRDPETQPRLNTRADEPTWRMVAEDIPILEPGPRSAELGTKATEPQSAPEPQPVTQSHPQPQNTPPVTSRTPVKNIVPNTLPSEMLAVLRRPHPAPAAQPQSQPTTTPAAFSDPNVKPASATVVSNPAPTTPAIHGAMKAGQTIVYVLDCSGSMGEFGKLTLARAALMSTLRRQPGEVRFQLLAYNSTARSVLPGGCVAATPTNIAAAETALAALKATGRSNHVEAVRAAAALRPDVIVLLTDADELTAASFKTVLAGEGKAIPLCVARVSAEGVGPPRELK